MTECLKSDVVARRADAVAYDRDLFWELFVKAVACIKRAKPSTTNSKPTTFPTWTSPALKNAGKKL
jgi:hypothetical protein